MQALQGRSISAYGSIRSQHQSNLRPTAPPESWTKCRKAASSAAAAVAVALALQSSVALAPAVAQGQPALCPSQPSVVQQQQQQQQRQHVLQGWRLPVAVQPLAELAGFFDNADPTDPFTLYGTNFKKYEIERMQGEKVVSRSRGFTVDTCVSGKTASEETPMFNGMSTGAKVEAGEDLLCKRATGPDLKVACKQSCGSACESALAAYEARLTAETGLTLDSKERQRVLKNCRHSCSYECTKSGKSHDFVVPSRR